MTRRDPGHESPRPSGHGWIPVLVLVGLALALLSANLGQASLLPSDDAIYAQAAREMLESGRPWDPSWQGRPLYEKGPVWLAVLALSQSIGGSAPLAVHLPGVFAGVLLLWLVYLVGRQSGLSRGASLASAALLLVTSAFYFNARRPMMDIPATALGLGGFLLVAGARGPGRAGAGGVLLGLSCLVKFVGPAPFVLALAGMQAWPDRRRPGLLAIALVVALAVALPWHASMFLVHGRDFVDVYFLFHLFERASVPVVGPGALETYVAWIVEREGLAALAVAAGIGAVVVGALRGRPGARDAALLAMGAILPLAFSATGLPHYLVPVLPGAVLAFGVLMDSWKPMDNRIRILGPLLLVTLFVGTFAGNNLVDMLEVDNGQDTRELCSRLVESGAAEDLEATADLHDPAVTWYCGRPVDLLAVNPGFRAATRHIPMLKPFYREPDAGSWLDMAGRGAVLITGVLPLAGLQHEAGAAGVRLEEIDRNGLRLALRVVMDGQL